MGDYDYGWREEVMGKKNRYTGSGRIDEWNSVFVECKHKSELILVDGPVCYYGSTLSNVSKYRGVENIVYAQGKTLLVNLSGARVESGKNTITGNSELVTMLSPHVEFPIECLAIDWPDGGAPPVAFTFWDAFRKSVTECGFDNVIVYCIGGHGRTGTFLGSIMLAINPTMEPDSAIADIRMQLCSRCIETRIQSDYIRALSNHYKGGGK